MFAEHALHYPVGYERRCEQMLLEVETIALYLLARHGERRLELSEQSTYAVGRNSPYAEEAEHMVDAVSVEILSHVLEAAHPPLATVCYHAVPVVCRESPVLSVHRESVWRSTRLRVEVEVFGLVPYVAAVAVHADRNVALEDDAASACIFVSRAHLLVEHELHVVVERHLII